MSGILAICRKLLLLRIRNGVTKIREVRKQIQVLSRAPFFIFAHLALMLSVLDFLLRLSKISGALS